MAASGDLALDVRDRLIPLRRPGLCDAIRLTKQLLVSAIDMKCEMAAGSRAGGALRALQTNAQCRGSLTCRGQGNLAAV